jgi:coenzyme F420 hydrogenase subunit beta
MTVGSSPTVTRVLAGELCSGCGLCASVSAGIKMGSVSPGYNRPVQSGPVSANEERVIAAACPGAVVAAWPDEGAVHPYWGPYKTVSTGFATDPSVRFQGSSGGAITAIAIHALQSGLADRIVHVTANPVDPTGNMVSVSRTAAEVLAGAGSRYVSSSPLSDIDRLLGEPGAFVFIGKPCDVSALRRLGQVDPRVAAKVPLMLAFFCAGIPSRAAVGRVLAALDVEAQDLAAFRYRGNGWPGKAAAVTRDGRVSEMTYEASWGGFLSHEVQFRCKICPDAVGGAADIACADAWYGGESGYPSYEEMEGRSLVMARTARGQDVLDAALAAAKLAIEPLDIKKIDLMQPSQARRKRLIRARTAAVRILGRPTPRMESLKVAQAAGRAPAREALRNFLGTLRRALNGKLSHR